MSGFCCEIVVGTVLFLLRGLDFTVFYKLTDICSKPTQFSFLWTFLYYFCC